jgi:CheY-like chemotaxis protein
MENNDGLNCILLIDDDEATNFIHTIIINKILENVQIPVALNGIIALEYLTKTGKYEGRDDLLMPCIILLDINMPGMNGWEFLEEYKKLPEGQKAKMMVAMLTTSLNPDDRKRAKLYKDDVIEFLNKPLTIENLNEIIDSYFEVYAGRDSMLQSGVRRL